MRRLGRARAAAEQLGHLRYEIGRLVNGRWWRLATVWTSPACWVLVSYRLERALYVLMGRGYAGVRLLLLPLRLLADLMGGRHEINYRADIGRGLRVLHPVLGVVVNGHTRAGEGLILTGGNCIGGKVHLATGDILIGDNVNVGANASIIGPCQIGDRVTIGAGAVVVADATAGSILVGVPARRLVARESSGSLSDFSPQSLTGGRGLSL